MGEIQKGFCLKPGSRHFHSFFRHGPSFFSLSLSAIQSFLLLVYNVIETALFLVTEMLASLFPHLRLFTML